MALVRVTRPLPTLASGLAILSLAGAALGAAGALVSGFGPTRGGVTYLGISGVSTRADAVAVDAGGRFVVAGSSARGQWVLGRVDLDGTVDETFGDGRAVAGGLVVDDGGSTGGSVRDLIVLPTGRILVAGRIGESRGETRFAVRRYTPGGSPDPRFAGDGTRTVTFGADSIGGANAIATRTVDGDPSTTTIVAAGYHSGAPDDARQPALARFLSDGALDPSFGGAGVISRVPGLAAAEIHDVAALPDGGVLAVGDTATLTARPVMIRLRPDGSPDPSFGGGDGVLIVARPTDCLSASYRSVLIDTRGRFVVAGTARCDARTSASAQFLVARHQPDGLRDVTFGTIGITLGPDSAGADAINAIVEQSGGSIVGVGSTGVHPNVRPAVVRLRNDGTFDPSFGHDGIVSEFAPESTVGGASAVAIGRDGHLVTAGWASVAGTERAAIAKYDGALTP